MSRLNPQQLQAIAITDAPLLVLAGAGSGKTTVITHKISDLVRKQGIAPEQIYAVTFTNKAAREMKERVSKQLKGSARHLKKGRGKTKGEVSISTFHTLGLSIIRHELKSLGIKPGFSIFDAHDSASLLKELLPGDESAKKELGALIQRKISSWKNALLSPDQALQTAQTGNDMSAAEVYAQYNRHLRAYNAVDFDDLILMPTQLFEQQAEILDRWQNRVRYLLVDEYQDTNASQYQLVKQLVGVRQALTVVGDDDQSIYSWRGAVPENLARLQDDFPRLKVIKLEQNYRSSIRILKAANQLISNNSHLFEKRLWSELGYGDPLRILKCQNESDEAERVVMEIVSRRLQKSYRFCDFAILYRSNYQSRILEMKLQQNQVPYKVSGGISIFEKIEVKDILAYLKLIANPDDDTAFLRIVNVPRRQIGPATLEALANYANSRSLNLLAACDEMGLGQHLKDHQLDKLRRFKFWLESVIRRCHQHDISTALNEMLEELGYHEWLRQNSSSPAVAEKRMENVRFLVEILKQNLPDDDQEADNAVGAALAKLMLQDMLEKQNEEEKSNQVQLMTLHASKGLEFPEVFIIGLEEDILPHANSLEAESLEEERRLFYVGITRAQKSLTMTFAGSRKQYGEISSTEPSRFLQELPRDDIEWEGLDELPKEVKRARGKTALKGLLGLMET